MRRGEGEDQYSGEGVRERGYLIWPPKHAISHVFVGRRDVCIAAGGSRNVHKKTGDRTVTG